MLQVKIKEGEDADDIFSRLMGDVVEPRREFIQEQRAAPSPIWMCEAGRPRTGRPIL